MKRTWAVVALTLVAFIAGVSFSAPVKEAWHWPDSMDALAAAPEFHKAVFENDHVRLLEDEFSENTGKTASLPPRNEGIDWATPQSVLFEPTPPHALTNKGTYPIHFYRMEFKRMEGNDLMKRSKY